MALSFFTLLEAALTQNTAWAILSKVGTDLCNLSIGIVGGMFLNAQLQNKIGGGSAVIGIAMVLVNLILAALVMLVTRRFSTMALNRKAYISIFLGLLAVAVPSVTIMWFGVK